MKKIECIIMDWAGTAVDYGCFAPVAAFLKAFKEIGITISMEQARRPMGMAKVYDRQWTEDDVIAMNKKFEGYLFASLADYTDPIPGVIETLQNLRSQGLKIGSTTGYTQAMMDVVLPNAAAKGYKTDNCVTPDRLPAGRPYPYMIYQNMIDLDIPSVDYILKYGDTIADIKEGRNAKVWTVGVILGSNEMGLTEKEVADMPDQELETRKAEVRKRMLDAGAHFVVDTIKELPSVIDTINKKLNNNNSK